MKNADTRYIIIGKIGTTFGVKGWIKIHSYTEFGADILQYQPWYWSDNQKDWQEASIEEGRLQGNTIVVKFPNINSPETARLLTGKTIAVIRTQLPTLNKNEFYWSDLEGLTVINKDGEILGKVLYLIATGSNDVLVVKRDKEYAIPYLPGSVVLSVDLAKGEIHVDWELI